MKTSAWVGSEDRIVEQARERWATYGIERDVAVACEVLTLYFGKILDVHFDVVFLLFVDGIPSRLQFPSAGGLWTANDPLQPGFHHTSGATRNRVK